MSGGDSMDETMCAACGLPGHRYGRNEGMERFDRQACINMLLREVDDAICEIERLRAENRALQDVIDEAHGELDYLSPSTNGLEHGLWERLVAIRDQETA